MGAKINIDRYRTRYLSNTFFSLLTEEIAASINNK